METKTLQETFYCDFSHTSIKVLSQQLSEGETDPRKLAEKIFLYVRDQIKFGLDLTKVKASETLVKGYGPCWSKALLMMALLRCNHIPARLGYSVVTREFMKLLLGDEFIKELHDTENHCFVLVGLDGQWIAVDPTLDIRTYNKFFVPAGVNWGIEWNGKDNMQLYTENIVEPLNCFEDIDAALNANLGYEMPSPEDIDARFGPSNQHLWQD
jgi:transglutaminase-like putative cysteine protease